MTDLELALLLADAADAISGPAYADPAVDLAVVDKPDGSQVTRFDVAIEDRLRSLLAEHRPGDAVLGEERGATGTGDRRWVIDPIDGTGDFIVRGLAWSTLIALEVGGVPVVGVASMPSLRLRWWGSAGDGASRGGLDGGSPASISPAESVGSPLRWAYVVDPDQLAPERRELVAHLEASGPSVPFGRWTTYPSLMVAQGDLDCCVQTGHRWDLAAHEAIVAAAGGTVTVRPWRDGQELAVFSSSSAFSSAV